MVERMVEKSPQTVANRALMEASQTVMKLIVVQHFNVKEV